MRQQQQITKDYYHSHDPFAKPTYQKSARLQQYMSNQPSRTNLSNNNSQLFKKSDYQTQQLENTHIKNNLSLPSIQTGLYRHDNQDLLKNNRNSRYNLPSVSPIISQSKKIIEERKKPNYNLKTGFILIFDSVINLPDQISSVKIEYSIQDLQGTLYLTDQTKLVNVKENSTNVMINQKRDVKGVDGEIPDDYIYFELEVKSFGINFFYNIATSFRLFQESNKLNAGKFKIPFYILEEFQDPGSVIFQEKYQKPFELIYLNFRILYPDDQDINKKVSLSEYRLLDCYKQEKYRKNKKDDNDSDSEQTGVNGNPKSKIKVQPLKAKYDMDKLKQHMIDMDNISTLANRQKKNTDESHIKNDSNNYIAQKPEWFTPDLEKKQFASQRINDYNPQQNQAYIRPMSKFQSPMKNKFSQQKASNPNYSSLVGLQHKRFLEGQQQPPLANFAPNVNKDFMTDPENANRMKIDFGGLKLQCRKVTNFKEDGALAFDTYLLGPAGQVEDRRGEPCQAEADQVFDGDPSDNICHMDLDFELYKNPYLLKKEHPGTYLDYHLILNFMMEMDEEEHDLGWHAFRLFDQHGNLRQGEFTEQLFKPPIQQTIPLDYSKIVKMEERIVFNLQFATLDQ